MFVSLWVNSSTLDKKVIDKMFNVFYIDLEYVGCRMVNYLRIDLLESNTAIVDRILEKQKDKYAPKKFREACVKYIEENMVLDIVEVGRQFDGFWEERVIELLEKGINRGVVIGVKGLNINIIKVLCNNQNIQVETTCFVDEEDSRLLFKQRGFCNES